MKISVITINYNNKSGLELTLKSVFEQSMKPDYVIIDGGSSDGSKELLQENNGKISYWISEKDSGVYEAMNKGIKVAKGEYLLFLNSGDFLFENNTLEKINSYLDSKADIVYGNLKINDNGTSIDGFMPDKIDLDHMIKDTLWHPVSFIKKDLFEKYGSYSTQYKISGDYDFFFRVIIAQQVSTKYVNQFISVFKLDGMSSDLKNHPIIIEEKKKIQRNYLSDEELEKYNLNKKSGNFFNKWFQ